MYLHVLTRPDLVLGNLAWELESHCRPKRRDRPYYQVHEGRVGRPRADLCPQNSDSSIIWPPKEDESGR